MLTLHQAAIDLVSRMVTHNDMVGNPTETNDSVCVVPVANFNFSEITMFTVEVVDEKLKITKEEKVVEKSKIDEITIKAFKS